MTSCCHHCLGLPTGLVPIGFQFNSFLVGHAWSILWICPSHLILCALMNLTISAPSINLPISMLFHVLHISKTCHSNSLLLYVYDVVHLLSCGKLIQCSKMHGINNSEISDNL
jgi:hypothetical protein